MSEWKNRIIGEADVPPDQLQANPRNFRIHPGGQAEALRGVLGQVGWVQRVIVNQRTGYVVDGHLRVMEALKAGAPTVPVIYVDLDPDEEALVLATLDPLSAMAGTDSEALDALLREVSTDSPAVAAMLDELAQEAGIVPGIEPGAGGDEFDATPEPEGPTRCQPGDLWIIGGVHRLIIGDSTDPATVARLMQGRLARCMWTDPPYGVNYEGKSKAATRTKAEMTIQNDGPENLDPFLKRAFAAADTALDDGAAIYVAHPPGALHVTFGNRFLGQGWRLHQTLIWVKNSMVLGHSDYHFQHEPIHFGYKPGPGRWGRGGQGWYGDDAQVSVFHVDRPSASRDHPTEKPVELILQQMQNSVRRGCVVYDGFAGSGPVLTAAHRLGCEARLIELDTAYGDVILRRAEAEGLTVERAE